MNITIFEVFELNKILHSLSEQQLSYDIKIAFKIHKLIKWLDETETFIFERMRLMFSEDTMNGDNPLYVAFLSAKIPLVETTLTINELITPNEGVSIGIKEMELLGKILGKTES